MTDEQALISQIHKLPESLKAEVARFVSKLTGNTVSSDAPNGRRPRKPGSAAGKYHMAPDFDEPLEDFKDYM